MNGVRTTVTDGDIYNAEVCGFYPGSDVTCHVAASTSAGSSPNATTNVTLPCEGIMCFIVKILSKVATVFVNSLCPNSSLNIVLDSGCESCAGNLLK